MRWSFRDRKRARTGRALLGLALVALLLSAVLARAAEKLPPAPARHFNDYANVVPAETAAALDAKLAAFEKESSNQILVAVFPKLETDSSIEDFTQRTAEAWRAGDAKRDNGAVLFVFVQDRKMRIEVGYGLEGALPDATAKRIIAEEIAPAFKTGNYAQGLSAGVEAMIKATRGEYTGSGQTNADRQSPEDEFSAGWLCLIFAIFLAINIFRSSRRGTVYSGRGRKGVRGGGWTMFPPMGGGWGGGGGGGGGFGGGGFSGGGGSFGGGGASGDW